MQEKLFDLFPELQDFGSDDFKAISVQKPTLMLAITARTGSTNLCAALGRALSAEEPTEILNPRGAVQWEKKRRGVSTFAEYLASLVQDAKDYFIFKSSWNDFQPISPLYRSIFPNIKVVYLNRLDIEAQAVSHYRAMVSGRWHKKITESNDFGQGNEDILGKFNVVGICQVIQTLELEKRSWEHFFFDEGLHPARLNYEDFSEDFVRAIKYISSWMNHPYVDPGTSVDAYEKLSDEINDQWLAKIRRYRSGQFYSDLKAKGLVP